jgi:hypothetical protein
LEITDHAAATLNRAAAQRHHLRGLELSATRLGGKPNGKLIITLAEHGGDHADLPDPPDVKAYLRHLWRLDRHEARTENERRETKIADVLKARANGQTT